MEKKNENGKVQLKGQLKLYIQWPAIMALLLIAMDLWVYKMDHRAGILMAVFVLIYIIMVGGLYFYSKNIIMKDLVEFAAQYGIVQNTLLRELSIPYAILLDDGKAVWMNDEFEAILGGKPKGEAYISKYIPELNRSIFPKEDQQKVTMEVYYDDKEYQAELRRVSVEGFSDTEQLMELPKEKEYFIAVYLQDVTELNRTLRENEEQRMVAGLVYIDNYDESLANVDDVRRSLLAAMVDRKINKYMLSIDAITRKIEKDKYIFLFQHKYLSKLQADKFSLLDDIRSINVGNDTSITISMGIGIQANTYRKRQEYARSAIDLALARGGDQVVIKTKDNLLYYGGKSIQQEKNTRVKARVKAQALRDSIINADKVVIMGHRLPDVDAIGSAIGIYRIAQSLEKPAKIIVNQVTSSLAPLLKLFENNKDYPDGTFVTSENAKEFIGNGNGVLLVVVDVNRPSYTDAPDLIPIVSSLVVIDHHRQTGESFENPTLSYVEPFASSASEMVAEILQYAGEEIRVKAVEADALYSGIMVDTNNFMNKPGVRTFEAVAFLRRSGADIIRIRKMFRSDIEEYKIRAEAIQNTEIFMDCFAISPCNADNCESPTIVGAKIADDLLDIKGIRATFVLTAYEGKVYISARSIDELNVQVVMEKMGGGGHITSAGAQLENCTLEEGAEQIKQILTKMKEEGDI